MVIMRSPNDRPSKRGLTMKGRDFHLQFDKPLNRANYSNPPSPSSLQKSLIFVSQPAGTPTNDPTEFYWGSLIIETVKWTDGREALSKSQFLLVVKV